MTTMRTSKTFCTDPKEHVGIIYFYVEGAPACRMNSMRWIHAPKSLASSLCHVTKENVPISTLSRLYFDTVVYDAHVLRFLVDTFGADHVLLGTDHSGDMSSWRDVPKIRDLDFLTQTQKEQILGGNAARLLGL
jgi:predicted TIM-barrel fold metal-dependent hydrolase